MKFDRKMGMAILAGLVFFLAAPHGWAREGTVQKSFRVSPGGSLNLDSDWGSVEVRGAAGNTVDIQVLRKEKELAVELEQRGNDVYVAGNFEGGIIARIWHHLFHHATHTRFVVSVPNRYNLNLRTAGGEILIDDLEGDVRAETSGGDLRLGKIKGAVTGNTSGGSIELSEYAGNARVHTSGGSIVVSDTRGRLTADTSGGNINADRIRGSIDAKTSGGHIRVRILEQPGEGCRMVTSGGSVTVGLDRDAVIDIDAKTSGGTVFSDFKVVADQGELKKSTLQGKINGGGPLVRLSTSGGDIRIEKM